MNMVEICAKIRHKLTEEELRSFLVALESNDDLAELVEAFFDAELTYCDGCGNLHGDCTCITIAIVQ